jgi:hypothetical protein
MVIGWEQVWKAGFGVESDGRGHAFRRYILASQVLALLLGLLSEDP